MTGRERRRRIASRWITITVSSLAAGALLLAASARAQGYEMKIGFATINDPQHAIGKLLAKSLNEKSNGRIRARVFPAGQLGKIARMIEGMQLGTVESLIAPPGFLFGIDPAFQVPDAPGLFDDVKHAHRSMTDPAFRGRFAELAEKAGIAMLALYIYGPTSFASLTPIRTLADLKGKKIRVLATKMESALVGRFGAAGIPMPYVEVLPALQRKAIDAVRSSIIVMGGSKFYTTAKYITVVESGMIPSAVFASASWLAKLPRDLRDLVIGTARRMEDRFTEIGLEYGRNAERLWKDNGAEVIRLSLGDRKLFMDTVRPLGDKFLGANAKTRDMYHLLKASAERNRR